MAASIVNTWQEQLKNAVTDPVQLLHLLNIDNKKLLNAAKLASQRFSLKVPIAFVDRMEKGNIHDPLLRQVLPIEEELIANSNYIKDPLLEQNNRQLGMIQKYQGRVLLMINGHCAINCRYCFRRHFPYEENRLNRQQWGNLLTTIANDNTIEEVIYSGGDPLASSDRQLAWLTEKIVAIPHIKRLRIHSRLPVVIPNRITKECLQWLIQDRIDTVFVVHVNHPNELNTALINTLKGLKTAGITVLNQAVLLKDINDNVETLYQLSQALFTAGVLPYYLHLFDPVANAGHFDVAEQDAIALYQELMGKLPGYLCPKLVREQPGKPAKTPIDIGF